MLFFSSYWLLVSKVKRRALYFILKNCLHSFILVISIAPLQVHNYSEALPTTARILYRGFTRSAQATVSKGLAQGPNLAIKAGVEPTTVVRQYAGMTIKML